MAKTRGIGESLTLFENSLTNINSSLVEQGLDSSSGLRLSQVADKIRQIEKRHDGYLCKGSEFRTRLYNTFGGYSEIEFTNEEPVTTGKYVDVSDKRDGSVIAWTANGMIKVGCYRGTIYAHQDCSTMFKYDTGSNYLSANCSVITFNNFDASNVTNMKGMFSNGALEYININSKANFDTSKVTDMSEMFYPCARLTRVPTEKLDTSSVTTMESMFRGCRKIISLNLSSFDTSKVTNLAWFCCDCSELTFFSTGEKFTACNELTTMAYAFSSCPKLTTVYLQYFDVGSVSRGVAGHSIFVEDKELSTIKCPFNWAKNLSIANSAYTFSACTSLPLFDNNKTSGMYAQPMSSGGYFV